MSCAFAELVAGAASTGHVELERWTDKGLLLSLILRIFALGMRLPSMSPGDEGGSVVEGELPAGDVSAQVDFADLESEAFTIKASEERVEQMQRIAYLV